MGTQPLVRESDSAAQTLVAVSSETLPGSVQEFRLTTRLRSDSSTTARMAWPSELESSPQWRLLTRAFIYAVYTLFKLHPENRGVWDRLKLELLRIAQLPGNWDSENAEAVAPGTVVTASRLLDLCRGVSRSLPNAIRSTPILLASPEGSIVIKWINGNRELKCIVTDDVVEVLRWSPLDAYESEGMWEVAAEGVLEHIEWLLR